VEIGDNFFETGWDSLDDDFKVALYAAYIDKKTGEIQERIVNKWEL